MSYVFINVLKVSTGKNESVHLEGNSVAIWTVEIIISMDGDEKHDN